MMDKNFRKIFGPVFLRRPLGLGGGFSGLVGRVGCACALWLGRSGPPQGGYVATICSRGPAKVGRSWPLVCAWALWPCGPVLWWGGAGGGRNSVLVSTLFGFLYPPCPPLPLRYSATQQCPQTCKTDRVCRCPAVACCCLLLVAAARCLLLLRVACLLACLLPAGVGGELHCRQCRPVWQGLLGELRVDTFEKELTVGATLLSSSHWPRGRPPC